MRCPFCQNSDTQVVDSRAPEEGSVIRRRRRCPNCGKRFTTFERAQLAMPVIVKKGGARVDYLREKLQASMSLALRKRPISPDKVDEAVDAIERAMILTGEREIRSTRLGDMVLEALQKLDTIAYIRFASVYFDMNDPKVFSEMMLEAIKNTSKAKAALPEKDPA